MQQTSPAPVPLGKSACRTLLAASMIALMLAAILPAAAQDEEQPRWFSSNIDDRTALLAYGIPDSDYVMVWFSCGLGAPVVKIGIQDEERSADDGAPMLVRLAAGAERIAFSTTVLPNEDSGGIEAYAALPLDMALRHILASTEPLEITLGAHTLRYTMDGASEPAGRMIAVCDAPRPANDLDVTVTNEASLPLQSFAYSEAGVNFFDSDAFGYEPLEPGASRTFTIPAGRDICIFDLAVLLAEADAECCAMPEPAGTRNLCENNTFIVHD